MPKPKAKKTLLEQLQEAVASGDLTKVQQVTSKMQKEAAKPKPKPKSQDDEIEVMHNSPHDDYIVSAQRTAGNEEFYVDDDTGEQRRVAKVVPFKVIKNRKNNFVDDPETLRTDAELDKKLHQYKNKKVSRPVAKKQKIQCFRCQRFILVWPEDVTTSHFVCDECLLRNKR